MNVGFKSGSQPVNRVMHAPREMSRSHLSYLMSMDRVSLRGAITSGFPSSSSVPGGGTYALRRFRGGCHASGADALPRMGRLGSEGLSGAIKEVDFGDVLAESCCGLAGA